MVLSNQGYVVEDGSDTDCNSSTVKSLQHPQHDYVNILSLTNNSNNRSTVRKSVSTTSFTKVRQENHGGRDENIDNNSDEDTPLLSIRQQHQHNDTSQSNCYNDRITSSGNGSCSNARDDDDSMWINRMFDWLSLVLSRICICFCCCTNILLSSSSGTPLQQAMQRSRHIRRIKSIRFWCMVLSILVILSTIVYYCCIEFNIFPIIKSDAINVYKVTFDEIDHTLFSDKQKETSSTTTTTTTTATRSTTADGSSSRSSSSSNLRHPSSISSSIETWMFGYSSWFVRDKPPDQYKTQRMTPKHRMKQQHKRIQLHNQQKTAKRHKRVVMVDLVTRQFHDTTSTDNSTSVQQIQERSNPAVYGWTPAAYPNPRYDPLRCGISYILDEYETNELSDIVEHMNSTNNSDSISDSVSLVALTPPTNLSDLIMIGTTPSKTVVTATATATVAATAAFDNNMTIAAEIQQPLFSANDNNNTINNDVFKQNDTVVSISSSSRNGSSRNRVSLNLCDPDWMLGGALLEEVATAMFNFTEIFSTQDDDNDQNNDWDIGISGGRNHETTMNMIKRWYSTITTQLIQLYYWFRERIVPNEVLEQQEFDTSSSFMDNNNDNNNSKNQQQQQQYVKSKLPQVELAVATVRKMNLLSVLRQGSFYAYEDQDDMVSDAAQIFARTLHDAWWNTEDDTIDDDDISNGNDNNNNVPSYNRADYGILLFLSIQDRICFISTGSGVQHILPWWRLDHIVASMKPDLRHQQYGTSIVAAIQDLTTMLLAGPPSVSDRLHDFITRFGVVIAFAAFTFVFGAWGEYRDRRKRWQYAEQRSKLNDLEKEKALCLQKGFCTKCCPICLENFDYGDDDEKATNTINNNDDETLTKKHNRNESLDITINDDDPSHCVDTLSLMDDSLRTTTSTTITTMMLLTTGRTSFTSSSVDKHGVPLRGADGRKIKILRCGHIFCDTCWKNWVHSGCGNPCNCPVCRQDVGRISSKLSKTTTTTSGGNTSRRHQRGDSQSTAGNASHSVSDIRTSTTTVQTTTVPEEVLSTSLHADTYPDTNPIMSLSSGYGSLTHHRRDDSLDGLLSTTDSISVEEDSLLVDSTISSPIRTSRNSNSGISFDMPFVSGIGGSASFLLYHHLGGNNNNNNNNNNNTTNNNSPNYITTGGELGQQEDVERTPLLLSNRNHNN